MAGGNCSVPKTIKAMNTETPKTRAGNSSADASAASPVTAGFKLFGAHSSGNSHNNSHVGVGQSPVSELQETVKKLTKSSG